MQPVASERQHKFQLATSFTVLLKEGGKLHSGIMVANLQAFLNQTAAPTTVHPCKSHINACVWIFAAVLPLQIDLQTLFQVNFTAQAQC